ncbi:DUF881 domain-containing protein [Streptomyces sp. NPDC050560]|uniref:DUF881 domain-containing protein n=1 Tax=Streptomyces sp. NPDC050560 TaxID=3365630 RepID=UPI003793EF14
MDPRQPSDPPEPDEGAGQRPEPEPKHTSDPKHSAGPRHPIGRRHPHSPHHAAAAHPEGEGAPRRPRPAGATGTGAVPHTGHHLRRELPAEVEVAPSGDETDETPAEERRAAPDGGGGRQRLLQALWPPRISRAQLIVALLLCGLGFGLAIQVASTSDTSPLRGARQEDLVRILDEVDGRTQRLEDEKQNLEDQRTELENSSDQAEEARKQTQEKERELGVLAGNVGAEGPGITLTIDDAKGRIGADTLLDTVQELRAAGAEAIQINDVRVVASTYLTDADGGGVAVDEHEVGRPYHIKVIGKPEDLEPALNIPGGVVQSLEKEQATVDVQREEKVVVDALRPAKRPGYARSSSR